jgi:Protein of unknown function (DUF3887)
MTKALRRVAPLTLAILTLSSTLSSGALAQLAKDAAIARAEAILKNLEAGKTADIVKEFDATLTSALPEAKLTAAWPALVSKFGAFKQIQERREGPFKDRQAVELILVFEKDTIVNRVLFDKDGKVAGLVFQPLASAVLPATK